MSNEALSWVWKHSPLNGSSLCVHLAIADSVNDQHGDEFWMRQQVLASKARTSRQTVNKVLGQLTEMGLLELLEQGSGGANRYRMLMPSDADLLFDKTSFRPKGGVKYGDTPQARGVSNLTTGGVNPVDTRVSSTATGGVASVDTEPKKNPRGEPKEIPSLAPGGAEAAPKATDDPVKRRAHQLTVLAFEQDRKPVTRGGFSAVMALSLIHI